MKKTLSLFTLILFSVCFSAALSVVLSGCFSPWAGKEGSGSITIDFGRSMGRNAAHFNASEGAPSDVDDFVYDITLKKTNGGETIEHRNISGSGPFTCEVSPGTWTVSVRAFELAGEDDTAITRARGDATVDVTAGKTTQAIVGMTPAVEVSTFDELFAAIGAANNGGTTIYIKSDGETENGINIDMSEEINISDNKTITLVAEVDVTLTREQDHKGNFFSVNGGGTLILGTSGMTEILTLDGGSEGNITANAPLISVTGGNLEMYDNVSLKNNDNSSNTGNGNGGGVSVGSDGTFNMYGGNIQGNIAGRNGGGVYVGSDGVLQIENGIIVGEENYNDNDTTFYANRATDGAALVVATGGAAGYGIFNAGGFKQCSELSTRDDTIHVENGKLIEDDTTSDIYLTVNSDTAWSEAISEISSNEDNGKSYVIEITANIEVPGISVSTFGDYFGTVTIRGTKPNGGSYTMVLNSNGGILLFIGEGQKVIIQDLILSGIDDNNASLVYVENGTFEMRGSSEVRNNEIAGSSSGGGVYVGAGSTFTMYDNALVHSNTAQNGGGVYVGDGNQRGTFNMLGGTIYDNSAENGGGVYVGGGNQSGTFNMLGGTIYGNSAEGQGGGVYVFASGHGDNGFFRIAGNVIIVGSAKYEELDANNADTGAALFVELGGTAEYFGINAGEEPDFISILEIDQEGTDKTIVVKDGQLETLPLP